MSCVVYMECVYKRSRIHTFGMSESIWKACVSSHNGPSLLTMDMRNIVLVEGEFSRKADSSFLY